MKKIYLLLSSICCALVLFAQAPADENYDDNAFWSASGSVFTLDGIRYTITGNAPYTSRTKSTVTYPLSSGPADYFLRFDDLADWGITSIRIEAVNGSAFQFAGFSMYATTPGNITVRPSTGIPLTYVSNGNPVLVQNVNTSANPSFQNITTVTFEGADLILDLDDLNFEAVITLPLTLENFSAKSIGTKTQLNWNTSNETNLALYAIETSVNGQSWRQLDIMQALNTPSLHDYNYTHSDPENGNKFYRLRMQDLDGKFRYTNILRIRMGQAIQPGIYPNPAKDNIVITLPGTEPAILQFINVSGQAVLQKSVQGNANSVDVRQLPSGIYSIKVVQGGTIWWQKMIRE
jgi:Secretion system C-terminal sorting domain